MTAPTTDLQALFDRADEIMAKPLYSEADPFADFPLTLDQVSDVLDAQEAVSELVPQLQAAMKRTDAALADLSQDADAAVEQYA